MTSAEPVHVDTGPADVPPRDILVIGFGNILCGDEGVGIHVLNTLEKYPALDGVTLVDGGMGGENLLKPIAASPIVIVIDATRDGKPVGTISVARPATVSEFPRQVSTDEFELKELFAAASLFGRFPEVHLFTVSIEQAQPMTMALTPEVSAAVPEVARLVNTVAVRLLSLKKDIPE